MFKRVEYKKPPLDEVVCQFRFPTILKINRDEPVEFQEKIRENYPVYTKIGESPINVNPAISIAMNNQFQQPAVSTIANHKFISEDGSWMISLTQNFVTLSTMKYHNWPEFEEKIKYMIRILNEVYSIPFYDRIGLRYRDVFIRSNYGVESKDWSDLITPPFLGLLYLNHAYKDAYNNACELSFDCEVRARVMTSIVIRNENNSKSLTEREKCLMIDSDISFDKRISKADADSKLEEIHKVSSYILRSAITDKMHELMGPQYK